MTFGYQQQIMSAYFDDVIHKWLSIFAAVDKDMDTNFDSKHTFVSSYSYLHLCEDAHN